MRTPVKIVLILSLILNVALIGVVGGFAYKKHKFHKSWDHKSHKHKLSDDTREKMSAVFRENKADMKTAFKNMRQAQEELVEILSAPVFDQAAFEQVTATLKEQKLKMIDWKMDMTAKVAAELTPEERQKMAGHLASMIVKGPRDHHKKNSYQYRKNKTDQNADMGSDENDKSADTGDAPEPETMQP